MNGLSQYLENQHCLGVNRLPARSPVIPAEKTGVYYKNKEASSFLINLNGEYEFRYSVEDDTPGFFNEDFRTDGWNAIDVPSMWQFRGYGKPRYTNIPYPFPFDPPYISCEDPVGYYRRRFTLKKLTGKAVLHFAGVENAFFAYVNGSFAGFAKGSRNAAEFDVTSLVKEGENLLCVKVFTYSDGSYLECQDMLWSNGIFRDVYLLQTGEISVWDYRVTSDLKEFTVDVSMLYGGQPGYEVKVEIENKTVVVPAAEKLSVRLAPDKIRLWNAETPELYTLTLSVLHDGVPVEVHSKKIGMLHSEIKGSHFLVNGSPVYIKGVNRHEYDCDNGRAISRENIEKELRMIKANGLNAIRTSHYTNDPVFYELCSEIGLYVMDEADVETHGCGLSGDAGVLTKDPEWFDAYLDRTRRMLENSKNEPCVFIHSMGNEFGEGENNYACQRFAAEFAPDILAISDHDIEFGDIVRDEPHPASEHFIRTGYLAEERLKKLDEKLPIYMQIEYAHGMGNSPGFLEGYYNFMYTHEKCAGGFVWEFKNHGFHVINADGSSDYLYGGDFGDEYLENASNFCLDGYLFSDRTPKPSWHELGAVSAPAWFLKKDEGLFLKNTYDFLSFSGASCTAELSEDGVTAESVSFSVPELSPHAEYRLPVPCFKTELTEGAAYFINYRVEQDGKTLGRYQQSVDAVKPKKERPVPAGEITVKQTGDVTTEICGSGFTAVIKNGLLTRFVKDGKTVLDSPLAFNFMRAPIDNDLIRNLSSDMPGNRWERDLLHTMGFSVRSSRVREEEGTVSLCFSGKILPQTKNYGISAEIEYFITSDGFITVKTSGTPFGEWDTPIPRIGMKVKLDGVKCSVDWLGRGPGENWPDSCFNAPVGLYSLPAEKCYTVFDRPQESGNRGDCRFVTLSYDSGASLSVFGDKPFCFTVHEFPFEMLHHAMHRSDIKKDGNTYLYIDTAVRGLGSHSCGPDPEPQFELYMKPFSFAFTLAGNLTPEKARELSRVKF